VQEVSVPVVVLRCLLMLAAALLATVPALAQTTAAAPDLSVGYATLWDVTSEDSSADPYKGWVVSGAYPLLWPRLSLVGEAGSQTRSTITAETQRVTAILGGPRFALIGGRLAAFGQLLIGMERFAEPGLTESGLAIQPGGGVDFWITQMLGARAQADYRWAQEGGDTYKEWRLSVGAVWRWR
jgi:hypothetical protein